MANFITTNSKCFSKTVCLLNKVKLYSELYDKPLTIAWFYY